jgi:exodeoxyribonuclease VII large subunit
MEKRSSQTPLLSVSDFLAIVNQTLEYAYPSIEIEGEVASFKINQGKFVFFDLKDAGGSVGCFMTVWQLRVPIEDGMKVIIRANPKITQWGKFSLTVQSIRPSGEGSLKKSYELLKTKLEGEGLFDEARKRPLPAMPTHIGVISSTAAAGYADFIKIIGDRWGGMKIEVAHTQVQGEAAPDQMIRAIRYFNEQPELAQILVIIRGGGSADDLSAFNDELLVREIAASRIPTVVGVGHEIDETLADFAADVRAATPSNAAQLIVPDKREIIAETHHAMKRILSRVAYAIDEMHMTAKRSVDMMYRSIEVGIAKAEQSLADTRSLLLAYSPKAVLERGYAIVRGKQVVGEVLQISTNANEITAEVKDVKKRYNN